MKKTLIKSSVLLASIFLLVACANWANMVKKFGDLKYTVTPTVLEARGGKVNFTINATIPPNFFAKKVTVKATPYIKYGEQKLELAPKTIQGSAVEGNGQTIDFNTGGKVTYKGSFDYTDDMRQAELWVKLEATEGESTNVKEAKLAEGISTVYNLMPAAKDALPAKFTFQRDKNEFITQKIQYLINSSVIRSSQVGRNYRQYYTDLKEADAVENKTVKGIAIYGHASPDGPTSLNNPLAERRAKAPKRKVSYDLRRRAKLKDVQVTTVAKGEDWLGFKEAVQKSDIPDKNLILRVVQTHDDPEDRDREIKNLSSVYEPLKKNIWPPLRRAEITATVFVKGKTDEEIASVVKSNPSSLTENEFIQAGRVLTSLSDKESALRAGVNMYPDSWQLKNDLAVVYMQSGKLDEAAELLKTSGSAPVVLCNQGVLGYLQKDKEAKGNIQKGYAKARKDKDIRKVKALDDIAQGKYQSALSILGGSNTYEEAVANLALGNTEAATKALNNAKDKANGKVAYLKAVIGARTGDNQMVYDNLKQAVAENSALKAEANTDIEFKAVSETQEFKTIVE